MRKRGADADSGPALSARGAAEETPPEPFPEDSAEDPRAAWEEYFSRRQPAPSVLAEKLIELHNGRKHAQVIGAIEAAMLNGQAQPWMYEVLALEMEIAGRPKEEIERVLFSAIDFTATDYRNMIASAAYLVRFGRNEPALHLYRQASRIEPSRPEPYVLGLKLARKLQDYDAVGWAASGILMYAWLSNHEQLHRDARDALLVSQEELRKAGREADAAKLGEMLAQALQRDLVLRLTWSGDGDLDLVVDEPLGTECSYEQPYSAGGGVLVHDGYGPKQSDCYEEYVCAFGAPGSYRVAVRHVWGDIVGKRAQLTVIRYQGTEREDRQVLTVPLGSEDQIVRVSLQAGRRTELAAVPEPERARVPEPDGRKAALRMMARTGRAAAGQQRGALTGAVAFGRGGAIGFQPIITVIPDGVTMAALAVVSGDRRYVRMSLSPNFTTLRDVLTFSVPGGSVGGVNVGGAGVGGQGQPAGN